MRPTDQERDRLVANLRAPSNWLYQDRGTKWKDAVNQYDRTPADTYADTADIEFTFSRALTSLAGEG